MEMAATSRSMTRSTGSISDFLEQIHEYRLDKVPLCLTVDNHYSHYSIEVYRKLKDLNMVLEYTPSASCIFNSCERIFSLAKIRLMKLQMKQPNDYAKDLTKERWKTLITEAFKSISRQEATNISGANRKVIKQYVEKGFDTDFPDG